MKKDLSRLHGARVVNWMSLVALATSLAAIAFVLASYLGLIDAAIALVAIAALAISIWQGWLMRQHNILSVRPVLDFVRKADPAALVLQNGGLGPALLYELKVGTRNIPLQVASDAGWEDVCKDLGIVQNGYFQYVVQDCTVISPGDQITLLRAPGVPDSELSEALRAIHAEASYKCIYGVDHKARIDCC